MNEIQRMITALSAGEPLQHEDWLRLIADASEDDRRFSRDLACKRAQARFGRRVFFRGIIEFTNYCKNDCYYCGIRCSNRCLSRYRLTEDEILSCCEEGYRLGYRTFVLQGGEDGWWTDEKITALVRRIRAQYPDCAITLSIGEKSREAYQAFFDAGADRYLLRHETANEAHYAKIHPARQTLSNRTRCLRDLKDIGYQTGAGMMIGAPYQTAETLAQDMEFLADLRPEMVGMGPFLPHRDTPFRDFPHGSAELTLYLRQRPRSAPWTQAGGSRAFCPGATWSCRTCLRWQCGRNICSTTTRRASATTEKAAFASCARRCRKLATRSRSDAATIRTGGRSNDQNCGIRQGRHRKIDDGVQSLGSAQ